MKLNKLAGVCVMIPILLSGCGNQPTAQTTVGAGQPAAQQQSQDASANAKSSGQSQGRPMMDPQQRQLYATFQTLLQMDKSDGLAITKEQAQDMLPTAQDITAKAELTEENKAKLLAKLTDAQKKFVEDAATRMNNQGSGNGAGRGRQDTKSGDASKPEASNAAGHGQGQPSGDKQGQLADRGADRQGNGNSQARPGGEMRDPGKQLIELLQSKAK